MDAIIPADSNETLRSILQTPPTTKNATPNKNNGSKSMKKIKDENDQLNKPGYSTESQFACRHCGKRYRWKSTMRRHEQVECGGKEPSFQCPHCPYKAKQKGNLGVHIRKHHLIFELKFKSDSEEAKQWQN